MYINCNRVTRKKMPPKKLQEFINKSKEYHAFEIYKSKKDLEASRIMNQSVIDAQLVAANVLPPELFREIYEEPELNYPVEYMFEHLYNEQMYRILPKEMYAPSFLGLDLLKLFKRAGGSDKPGKIKRNRNLDELKEINSVASEEVDHDKLRNYRRNKLAQAEFDIGLIFQRPIGLKPTLSGEEELTTTEAEETTTKNSEAKEEQITVNK